MLLGIWQLLPQAFELRITACDVGQGDAVLIQYGQQNILIDSGPNNAVLECLHQEIFWGNQVIDWAIVTHWDEDHIGGFSSVANEYQINRWLINPSVGQSKVAKELEGIVKKSDVFIPVAGDEIVYPGMRLRILWSERTRKSYLGEINSDQNKNSIALTVVTKSFGFFGTGDLECSEELAIGGMGLLDFSQIIKIAHHGAKNGTCELLFKTLRPEVAILSVGEGNTYDHPHTETLRILNRFGIFPKRTDQNGKIRMRLVEQVRSIFINNF